MTASAAVHDPSVHGDLRALRRERERLAAETEEDWVRMVIFSEWSHGYMQMPALMREGRVTAREQERARAMLDAVGLGQAMHKRPGELSGGMQQRVAIARAMVLEPPMVLADEPTGNLDTASSDEVFALMHRMHAERSTSFLVVTHDPRLAARCDRVLELVDGRLVRDQASGPGIA